MLTDTQKEILVYCAKVYAKGISDDTLAIAKTMAMMGLPFEESVAVIHGVLEVELEQSKARAKEIMENTKVEPKKDI